VLLPMVMGWLTAFVPMLIPPVPCVWMFRAPVPACRVSALVLLVEPMTIVCTAATLPMFMVRALALLPTLMVLAAPELIASVPVRLVLPMVMAVVVAVVPTLSVPAVARSNAGVVKLVSARPVPDIQKLEALC
jgi:hypothetical protein